MLQFPIVSSLYSPAPSLLSYLLDPALSYVVLAQSLVLFLSVSVLFLVGVCSAILVFPFLFCLVVRSPFLTHYLFPFFAYYSLVSASHSRSRFCFPYSCFLVLCSLFPVTLSGLINNIKLFVYKEAASSPRRPLVLVP